MYDRDLTLTLLKKLVSTDYATLNALQIDDAHDNVKTLIHACVEAAAALWLSQTDAALATKFSHTMYLRNDVVKLRCASMNSPAGTAWQGNDMGR